MKTIPEGYGMVSVGFDDVARWIGAYEADGSAFGLLASMPGFDPSVSAWAVSEDEGGTVAYAEALRLDAPYPRAWLRCLVSPAHRGRGIGSFLHRWMLAQVRPADGMQPVYLEQTVPEDDGAAIAFLEAREYRLAATCARMQRDLVPPMEPPELPKGISLSVVGLDSSSDSFLRENLEILRGHFATSAQPDESELRFISHLAMKEPRFDPPWHLVAHTSTEVGGICSCYPASRFDSSTALIPALTVRRTWRKRGLGRALFNGVCERLIEAGASRVEIHVPAGETSALRPFCDRVGMQEAGRMRVYRRTG